jgi:uncharacterized membrane protein YGL010W
MSVPESLDDWADRYGQLQAAGQLTFSNWIGISVLVTSLLGLLWSSPLPAANSPVLNAATLFIMATFVYYCILSIRVAVAGLVLLLLAVLPSVWLAARGLPVWSPALGAFLPAFAWQLRTTRRATGNACVIRNLQYLMLGPVWLLRAAFRRAGIAY